MKNLTTLGLAITALTACTGGGGGGGGGGSDQLTDPAAGLTYQSDCDGVEDSDGNFQEVTGATRYYVGSFDLTESETDGEWEVSGTESLVLFANQAWLDSDDENAADCEIVWNVFGTASGTEAAYSIAASARLAEDLTTCNISFAKEAYDESQELEYDVTVDTTSTPWTSYFTFPSGSELGSGEANDSGVTYASSAGCQFY